MKKAIEHLQKQDVDSLRRVGHSLYVKAGKAADERQVTDLLERSHRAYKTADVAKRVQDKRGRKE